MKKIIAMCAFALFLVACNNSDTINGSSVESMRTSVEKIQKSLNAEELAQFNEAMTKVASRFMFSNPANLNLSPEEFAKAFAKEINGKTAKDIIELGNQPDLQINLKDLSKPAN